MSTITLVKILQVHEDSFSSKKEKKKKGSKYIKILQQLTSPK